jgi:hypothetical protein
VTAAKYKSTRTLKRVEKGHGMMEARQRQDAMPTVDRKIQLTDGLNALTTAQPQAGASTGKDCGNLAKGAAEGDNDRHCG